MKQRNQPTQALTHREAKDLKILALFTSVYCRAHHDGPWTAPVAADPELRRLPLRKYPVCADCAGFLGYAFERRLRCPLEEKPSCKHCPVHCYKPGHREKVREIMRFSGQYLIRRGRLDLLWHYLF
ncbi:MAG: nitrous oxide-stimulated promoter family protein [Desulfuromonas sp.]|nr:nitrous oxide-stimulated promoter family protein [Desulfuromonas sp.]